MPIKVETKTIIIEYQSDGLLKTRMNPKYTDYIGIEEAKENFNAIDKISDPQSTLLMVIMSNGKFTKEARSYYLSKPPIVKKTAVVARNAFFKMVANFFMGANKPNIPIRIFTNEIEAEHWLKSNKQ